MIALLDVNVLVALAWPNHIHHEMALHWFEKHRPSGWATCPLTQSGFVRVSSNKQVIPEAKTPAEALLLLRRITELEKHVFWMDDINLAHSDLIAPEKLIGHRQVTNAHFVALAIRHKGQLATFDRGVAEVVPLSSQDSTLVILLSN